MDAINYNYIGNGAHWEVYQIIYPDGNVPKSTVHKIPFSKHSIDANLKIYRAISEATLPTLTKFNRVDKDGKSYIVAEDLNPPGCDGYFVSPNTVRNARCEAMELIDIMYDPAKINGKNQHLAKLLGTDISEEQMEGLRRNRFLHGAEKYLYENKVKKIVGLPDFFDMSSNEMRKAAESGIELFADAFFFCVNTSDHTITFRIADFDCIILDQDAGLCREILYEANLNWFKESLAEYLEYFIDENERLTYLEMIR